MNGGLRSRIVGHKTQTPESVKKRDTPLTDGVTKVADCSALQAAIRQKEHLEPGPVQHLARWISQCARNLRKAGIETEIHWGQAHCYITRK